MISITFIIDIVRWLKLVIFSTTQILPIYVYKYWRTLIIINQKLKWLHVFTSQQCSWKFKYEWKPHWRSCVMGIAVWQLTAASDYFPDRHMKLWCCHVSHGLPIIEVKILDIYCLFPISMSKPKYLIIEL